MCVQLCPPIQMYSILMIKRKARQLQLEQQSYLFGVFMLASEVSSTFVDCLKLPCSDQKFSSMIYLSL